MGPFKQRELIVFRQSLIHKGKVRINQCTDRKILLNDFVQKKLRLFDGCVDQGVVKIIVRVEDLIRGCVVSFPKIQPIREERIYKSSRVRMIEHAANFIAYALRIAKSITLNKLEQ